MRAPKFSEFELLLIQNKNQLGVAVLLLLAWIAASDGQLDQSEIEHISDISKASNHGHEIKKIINIARSRDLDSFQLACEIISTHFKAEQAMLFMGMAIGVAVADGKLFPAENYILRFIADLLGLSSDSLKRIYADVSGWEMPEPSDPSTAEFWRMRESSGGRENNKSRTDYNRVFDPHRISALSILGLSEGASYEDIKVAYRRLAQVHHPDRFASLGPESVAAATQTFQRIKQAYDYLTSNA